MSSGSGAGPRASPRRRGEGLCSAAAATPGGRRGSRSGHGVVVDSVNVRVLLYVPVRSASLAPIDCLKLIVTASLEVGADQVFSVVGLVEPPTAANAPPALACSACGNANVPLTSLPVLVELGSATDRVASPAVEITLAVLEAV